jgi:hypothetical protein
LADAEVFLTGFSEKSPALLEFSAFCLRWLLSKHALKILIEALWEDSELACSLLQEEGLPFELVFSELVVCLTKDRATPRYIQALLYVLQLRSRVQFEWNSLENDQNGSDSSSIPDFAPLQESFPEESISNESFVSTPFTLLFCKAIVFHSQLGGLLQPSAGAISTQFAEDFAEFMRKPKQRHSKLDLVAAFSNALQSLEADKVYSIVHSLSSMLPDSMLFLGVSLQSLPRTPALFQLQKLIPYARVFPDQFGRTIALVAHANPAVALSFINSYASNSIARRRFLLVFRSSEMHFDAVTAVYRVIGHCSMFVDIEFFKTEFLVFATSFLNKHLVRSADACFAIRKLATRVLQWQKKDPEAVWPFKDFLVQFLSDCDPDVPVLNTLSVLMPVRPIRFSDRFSFAANIIKGEETINDMVHAVLGFAQAALHVFSTLDVFLTIVSPLFPNLLLSDNWKVVLHCLHTITAQFFQELVTRDAEMALAKLDEIEALVTFVLPLCYEDWKQATETVCFLCGAETLDEVYLNMTSSRILELILRILALFKQRSVVFHQKGGALAISALLQLDRRPGVFCTRVVTLIIDILSAQLTDSREVSRILMSCIRCAASSHLKEVLVSLSIHSSHLNLEKLFLKTIAGKEEQFLKAIVEVTDEKFMMAFVPLMGKVISKTDDQTFSMVMLSVLRAQEEVAKELLCKLFGEEEIWNQLRKIADERKKVFGYLLRALPDRPTPLMSKIALCCAVLDHEKREFLEYAVRALHIGNVVEISRVFREVDVEIWADFAGPFIDFFIKMIDDAGVVDCLVEFASISVNCDLFWNKFGVLAKQDIVKYGSILWRILQNTDIEGEFLRDLVPALLLHRKEEEIAKFIEKKWEGRSDEEILTGIYGDASDAFLKDFIEKTADSVCCAESARFIGVLCKEVNEETEAAVAVLIDVLPAIEDDPDLIANVRRLLS